MSYEQKYLKYKNKYLNLQSQIGGGVGNPPGANLLLELQNYIEAGNIRDYIVGVLQANMGGQIPVAILNPPNHFNDNMRNLCNRFFNLFNGENNNQIRDDLVNRLLNLNLNNPYNNIINN
jgi:hypothetical protein